MRRAVFDEDHESFRKTLRAFIQAEVVPHYQEWYEAGIVPRDFYYKLGDLGIFGIEVPEEYGGAGISTFKYYAIEAEETARAGVSFGGSGVHAGLCLPYLLKLGTPEQLAALAAGVRHRGDDVRDRHDRAGHRLGPGRHAHHRDACPPTAVTTSSTGPRPSSPGASTPTASSSAPGPSPPPPTTAATASRCWSSTPSPPGYAVGRKLDKIGLRVSDTAELTFSDVIVPAGDLLGEEDKGFSYLGQNLPQERLSIAYGAYAQAAAAVRFAVEYTKQRTVFGKEVASFQNTKFELAACQAEVDAAQAVADRALEALDAGELTPAEAASAKLFCTEIASEVIDRCLQLHGGYGYINEYPIARLYADNRVNRIYGGTSEVMKTIIAKNMGL